MKTLHGTVSFARNIEELFDGMSGFRYPCKTALICGNGLRARKAEHFNKYG